MNAQAGERYCCSDANCECEIEITIPSAAQYDGDDEVFGSANDRSIVCSLSNADAASQRHPEEQAISTPGDCGSQEPGGEGMYASGENPRPTASERSGAGASRLNSGSSYTSRLTGGSAEEATFFCCCGQPMRKSSSHGHSSSREMA